MYVNRFKESLERAPWDTAFVFDDVDDIVYAWENIVDLHCPWREKRASTDLNYWIKLLSCIIEANGGHIGLSHINLHWYY